MKNFALSFSCFIVILSFQSCIKSADPVITGKPQPVSAIPNVEILSVSLQTIKEFKDSITIKLKYTDGDGDLGSPNPDSPSIFIQDSRMPSPEEFVLKPLSPSNNSSVSITGILDITIPFTAILDSVKNEELFTYSVYVKDKAKNKSNIAVSKQLKVIR